MAVAIVGHSLLLIRKDGVGFVDFFEALFGVRGLVYIRMIFTGQAPKGRFDLRIRSPAGDAEDIIVVAFRSHSRSLK